MAENALTFTTRTDNSTRLLPTAAIPGIDIHHLKVPATKAVVGRSSDRVHSQPDIALDLFDALEKGVSRRHIWINHINDLVLVSDLDSTNGTWLNGVRLVPGAEYRLKGGDTLKLGSLELTVRF